MFHGPQSSLIGSWLAPVFLILFYRSKNTLAGVFISTAVFITAGLIAFWNVMPLPIAFRIALLIGYNFLFCIPFFADYLLSKKIIGFANTLVLPISAVIIEYLLTTFSPYGTSGSVANTQTQNLPVLQLASVTGIYGITFFMYWFYSVTVLFIQDGFSVDKHKKGFAVFLATVLLVFTFGSFRLAFFRPVSMTAKVVSLTVERGEPDAIDQALTLTEREAGAGADIIMWQEAALLFKADEEMFPVLEETVRIAREYDCYILAAYVIQENPKDLARNLAVLITPEGKLEFEYQKARPLPQGLSINGPDIMQAADTPFGRISAVICYDADFPTYIRQASAGNIDILLVPSSDWKEIDPLHTRMISLRAVENGISLVRHSYACLSMAWNYLGEPLASMDYFSTKDRVMISHLPTERVFTLYGALGDYVPWLCIAGLILLVVIRIKNKADENSQ